MGDWKFPRIKFVPNREIFLEKLCRDKTVLHLGCADAIHMDENIEYGKHLHLRIHSVARKVYGVDFDNTAIQKLMNEHNLENLYVGDVEKLDCDFGTNFDLIVSGELIEHLNNPGLFLNSTKKYMTDQTTLVITTPNLLSLKLFLHSLVGSQRVHPDHSIGFTFSLIETLLSRYNYQVVEWKTSVERFASNRNSFANHIFNSLFSFFPKYADTLIIIAKRTESN